MDCLETLTSISLLIDVSSPSRLVWHLETYLMILWSGGERTQNIEHHIVCLHLQSFTFFSHNLNSEVQTEPYFMYELD